MCLQDSPSTRQAKYAYKPRRKTFERESRFIYCHLAITKLLNNFTNTIECTISSLHTRTACERKQTRNNLFIRSQAHHRPRKKINLCRLACIVHVTVCATHVAANSTTSRAIFDTDSIPIRVDNCATASISNNLKDFQGPLAPARGRIKGITGYTHNTGMMRGTIAWSIEDDQGQVHTIRLPGSYYVPDSTSRILSPQHWSQQAQDNRPQPRGTWCATYDDEIVLYWDQRKYKRTIRLDPDRTNTATIRSAPGYSRFMAFSANLGELDDEILAYQAPLVSDDENPPQPTHPPAYGLQQSRATDQRESMTTPDQRESEDGRNITDFNLDGPPDRQDLPAVITDEEDRVPQDVSVEFLRWHQRLGHISPKKIKIMAQYGILPRRLATCRVPMCTTCMFGKATKRPWRTKAPQNRDQPSHTITKPGDCVSVDQLESSTPGLIGQLRGIPTIKRYEVATVFIDHYSGLSYVHLQKSTTAIETVEAKDAFLRYRLAKDCQRSDHCQHDNDV